MNPELVTVTKDAKAITIPYGTETLLFKDEKVYITQTLGGSFTVQRDNGQLVRIDGRDAEALGKEVPEESKESLRSNMAIKSPVGRKGSRSRCLETTQDLL